MMLDPESVEAIAVRVVELLEGRGPVAPAPGEMIDANEVARRYSLRPEWVRRNADRLGGIRVGDGPRARLRFDPERVAAALSSRSNGVGSEAVSGGSTTGIPPRRRRRSRLATSGNLPVRTVGSGPLPTKRPGSARDAPGPAARSKP